jgi:hypothetical protein
MMPPKRCIFVVSEANKRQTIVIYEHSTMADVLASLGLKQDGSWQVMGDDGRGLEILDHPYPHIQSGKEVPVCRHPQAGPYR